MPFKITVPRLGWSMDEGTFVGWLKKDGEPVKAGEPLFTLESDKAAQEVEATDGGLLRIPPDAPKAGDVVKVGALLGYLDGASESAAAGTSSLPQSPATAVKPAPAIEASNSHFSTGDSFGVHPLGCLAASDTLKGGHPAFQTRENENCCIEANALAPAVKPMPLEAPGRSSHIAISPRARRRAAELGLDYRGLKGSGRSGRIREADVLAAAKETSAPGLSTMRRIIAQRTAESFARAPHFYLRTEVDATALLQLRDRLLPDLERTAGVRLTLTDLLVRAQALALHDCPHANAIWRDNRVARLSGCDIGLVVGVEDGLMIPIVRAADAGGLAALARQRTSLVDAARARKLTAEAMQGGATSLSNLGNTCVDEFAGVIASPQSSMLAVGRAAPRPCAVDGQVVVRTTLKLCLSVDHRVLDGQAAAKFLGRIVELIEHPMELARE